MGRTSPADPGLDEADRFFAAGRYDEAGRSYAALAQQNRLPADRRPHWAYCRWLEVVRRINRHPQSAREWDEIEAEVQSIQRLTPGNWYGEYLRSKIAESRRTRLGRRTSGASGHLVVRGSAPEESPAATPARRLPRLLGRSRGGAPAAAPAPRPDTPAAAPAAEHALNLPDSPAPPTASQAPAAAPDAGLTSAGSAGIGLDATPAGPEPAAAPSPRVADGSGAGASGSSEISWRIHESTNFRIYHYDLALARRAAEVAESVRAAQAKRWASPATRTAWSPRCELYLYPTGQAYGQATGQPENSPGISTMTNNGVLVLSRRMNLRGDNPQLLTSVLPHEVTHIVLADLFVARQIPRWADEGIAVLAEPLREQYLRSADLEGPLKTGQVFDLARLMSMDYPEPKDWSLYYAQSVSLTRYLVEQGPPERFLRFVQESQRSGPDTALRDVYQIAGLPALHDRWMVYARNQVAVATATLRGAESRPEQDVRR